MSAMGKTPQQMGIVGDYRICGGGECVLDSSTSDILPCDGSVSYMAGGTLFGTLCQQ